MFWKSKKEKIKDLEHVIKIKNESLVYHLTQFSNQRKRVKELETAIQEYINMSKPFKIDNSFKDYSHGSRGYHCLVFEELLIKKQP